MGADEGSGLLPAAANNDHFALGGVVLVLHTGGFYHFVLGDLCGNSLVHHEISQYFQQLLRTDSAGTQQAGTALRQIHNGGFHTHTAGTAVYNGINAAIVVVAYMLRCGGGGFAGYIGRRCGDGHTGQADNLTGNGTVRAAQTDCIQTAGGTFGNEFLCGQDQRQRTGPEALRQIISCLGNMVGEFLNLFGTGNVQDQGIILGTAFGLKNFHNGVFVQTVGTKTVDRFCGNCHQTAVFNDICRSFCAICITCGKEQGFHRNTSQKTSNFSFAASRR